MDNTAVKDIKLTNVIFSKSNSQYKISIRFIIEISASGTLPESYTLFWYENSSLINTYPLSVTPPPTTYSASGYNAEITAEALSTFTPDITKNCTVRIGISINEAETKSLCKTEIPVITGIYDNISGTYDGVNFCITWENPSPKILTQLQFKDNNSIFTSKSGKKYIEFSRPLIDFSKDEALSFTLYSYWDTQYENTAVKCISKGIASPETDVFTSTAVLKSVSLNEGTLSIFFTLPDSLAQTNPKCRADLILNGQTLASFEKLPITKNTTNYSAQILIPDKFKAILSKISLRLYISSAIDTLIDSRDNIVSLGKPSVTTTIDGINAAANFLLDTADAFYVLTDGETEEKLIYTNSETYSQESVINKEVKAAPAFIKSESVIVKGIYSESVPFFKKGFYASETNIKYLNTSNADSVVIPINEVIMPAGFLDTIEEAAFKLENNEAGSVLTITYSNEKKKVDLSSFINKLLNANISPYGYYKIRDLLARLTPCEYSDRIFFYCSAEQRMLSNELMPGFTLKIETAHFNRQTSAESKADNGFIKGPVSEYDINFNGTDLEFNSCFDYVSGSWTSALIDSNTDFGGLIDMFFSNFQSPYYRIIYPSAYFLSSRFPKTDDDDGQIKICTAMPNEEVSSINTVKFRGRTAITTEITITVNQQLIKIPLGTTLESLKARYGTSQISMRRQTGLGSLLPVYFTENTVGTYNFDKNFYLLAGDDILIN